MRREGKKWGKRSSNTLRYCKLCKLQSKHAYVLFSDTTRYAHDRNYSQNLELSLNKRKRWEICKLKPAEIKKERDHLRVKGYANYIGLKYYDRNTKLKIRKYRYRPEFVCYPKYNIYSSYNLNEITMIENLIAGNPKQRSHIDDVLEFDPEPRPKKPEYQYHIAFCENEHLLPESYGYLTMDINKGRLYDVTYSTSGNWNAFRWDRSSSSNKYGNNMVYVLLPGNTGMRYCNCQRANGKPAGFSYASVHRYTRNMCGGEENRIFARAKRSKDKLHKQKIKKNRFNKKLTNRYLEECIKIMEM